jgi:uroporphyrinogen decarboxylase
MTKKQRVLATIRREHMDYLPSQITLADRTRDKELHAALQLPASQSMDDYLENHLIISLAKADYPLFFRNDLKLMKELEAEGYCKVDEAGKVVYDSWGMGVRIGEDGFFCCFSPLEKKQERKFAERWMPERIWEAVTCDTLEERVRKWTPPDPDHQGNFEWCARDIQTYGQEYFVFPSGYFGIYERAYGMVSIPGLFENVLLAPKMVRELLDKITHYKVEMAKRFVKMDFAPAGHVGDDLGTQVGPFVPPKVYRELLQPQYKKLFKVYKDAGWHMMMHSCGCITSFLPELIDIGLDYIEPVQPCMDLPLIKKKYGKYLTFQGGIDTQKLLPFGTPQEVRQGAAEVIRLLGKGGGHVIAPSQEVMKDVPLENIVALLETIVAERASAHGL